MKLIMKNINSSLEVSEKDKLFAIKRAEELIYLPLPARRLFPDAPSIYFVDPALMDRLYPPERRRFLRPECVEEMIGSFRREFAAKKLPGEAFGDFLLGFMRKLERCVGEASSGAFEATGIYFSRLDQERWKILSEATGRVSFPGEVIFICPERVVKSAARLAKEVPDFGEKAFRFTLAKVLAHEMGHASLNGGKNLGFFWERIIEESLANAIAYQAVAEDDESREAFEVLVNGQPLEYRGWYFFRDARSSWDRFLWEWSRYWYNRTAPNLPEGPFLALHPLSWFYRALPESERQMVLSFLEIILPHPWGEFCGFFEHLKGIMPRQPELFWMLVALGILNALSQGGTSVLFNAVFG